MQKKSKTIVFTGGGTGGHIYPGLAVAQALKQKAPDISVVFVGADRVLDRTILEKIAYPFYLLPIGPLNLGGLIPKLKTLAGIPWAFFKGLLLLLKLRPSLVVGFGGYASFPSLFAAKVLGIPYALWEANAYPGLVTRKFAKGAKLIFLSFADSEQLFAVQKTFLYGTPTRFKPSHTSKSERPRILIFGGSSGAQAINEKIYEFLKKVNDKEEGYERFRDIDFVHQIGTTDFAVFRKRYEGFQLSLDVREFIHNMPEELGKASLVICRAGGSTVAEVAMSKKATIFVPLPWAADNHQVMNAKRLSDRGAAILIEQKDFSPEKIKASLSALLKEPERLQKMEGLIESFAYPGSAEKISTKLLDYISYKSLL